MWGHKNRICRKLRTRTEKFANESAAKARSGVFGGNNQDGQGLGGSTGSDSGPCDGAARVEPACERRNLRQRDLYMEGQSKDWSISMSGSSRSELQQSWTADVIAGEVIVYGSVKGNVRGRARSRSRRTVR